VAFLTRVMAALRAGSADGKLWAQGMAAVGAHYKVARCPVIKKQGISAYDPRVIEVTGISMMVTAQGADHTTGNAPKFECSGKNIDELVDVSMEMQTLCASADSLGLCVFGRSVTNANIEMMVGAINDACGTGFSVDWFREIGRQTLRYEAEFNQAAGFTEADDELPAFFYEEALAPSNKVARFHSAEVNASVRRWWQQQQVA
jgi:aldehyde:ferredoxin oxidoreductase